MEVYLCYICFEGEIQMIGAFDSMDKATKEIEGYLSGVKEMAVALDPVESCNLESLALEDCGWFIDVVKVQ